MGLMDKINDKFNKQSIQSAPSGSQRQAPPLGPESVLRYRKQRGINLGSWFVLERWIAEQPFRNAVPPGQSDHDVARGKDARGVLEHHWDDWIKEEDWVWIKEKGFNSVRIPIGYYHLCSVVPDVLKDTEFEKLGDVFSGAWTRIEQAIQTAERHGLGVLVDLHAAAGAQNTDAHSGLSTGKANLFNKSANLRSTSLALQFLATYLAPKAHVVGLQLLNEPANNQKLQGWYENTIKDIRSITGPDFPVYIHDAWDTDHYAGWVGHRDDFVVVDHHLYRCFTPADNNMSGGQHAQKLRGEFSGKLASLSEAAGGSIVIGEFSAALDDWNKGMEDQERDRNKREFLRAELELFEKSTAGWWYWTYKKGNGWDAGWSARDAFTAEILPRGLGNRRSTGTPAREVKERELKAGHDAHTNYWKNNGGSPNPAVYAPGFEQGWDDALIFHSFHGGVSEMGFVGEWAKRRKAEYETSGENLGKAAWEWEHGFKQGVEACGRVALA